MIDKVSKLEAYQVAKRLVVDVYAQLKLFPKEEQYALCDQMRRLGSMLIGLRNKRRPSASQPLSPSAIG